jgi:hypothetical protein
MQRIKGKSMNSIFNIRNISTLAIGALLGGQEAMAWCPTASARTINCQNCMVQLTCDVYGIQGINISGTNVTFDGGWHTIYNSTYAAVSVLASGNNYIRNLQIQNNSANINGINAISHMGDRLYLENVTANGGSAGVAHYYGGTVVSNYGSYSGNVDGFYAGYGASNGGYADSYQTTTGGNSRYGSYRETKPWSFLTNENSNHNVSHGTLIENSPRSEIKDGYFGYNTQYGKNGLRLVSSNDSKILRNSGASNGSYDCITVSSSNIERSGNNWYSSSGLCN